LRLLHEETLNSFGIDPTT